MTRISTIRAGLAAVLLAGGVALALPSVAREGIAIPAPTQDEPANGPTEVAVLAGGCFWGVQGVFQHVAGVKDAVSGYAGGSEATAQYHVVGSGATGHAEAVEVTFDPSKVSYGQILQVYFSVAHDPTELNRQGPDSGTQYRSAIFPRSTAQAEVAKAYIAQLGKTDLFGGKIVTTIEPDRAFYPAEGYHQNYLTLNPTAPYIAYNDMPKLQNLKRLYPSLWRDKPVLVPESELIN
ncbi:MAG: peptide-methionine (S)-S-oxide reductase MsrA [Amaricoccus sp.]